VLVVNVSVFVEVAVYTSVVGIAADVLVAGDTVDSVVALDAVAVVVLAGVVVVVVVVVAADNEYVAAPAAEYLVHAVSHNHLHMHVAGVVVLWNIDGTEEFVRFQL
jgi:hypothetical protein